MSPSSLLPAPSAVAATDFGVDVLQTLREVHQAAREAFDARDDRRQTFRKSIAYWSWLARPMPSSLRSQVARRCGFTSCVSRLPRHATLQLRRRPQLSLRFHLCSCRLNQQPPKSPASANQIAPTEHRSSWTSDS
eukprot:m.926991 g.926991  ORF g.926991 m.926991 type:complete len:135 (+) comp144850_c0_seq1:207-611(+)